MENKDKKVEEVSVPKEQLKNLLTQNEDLKARLDKIEKGGVSSKPTKINEHFAVIRAYSEEKKNKNGEVETIQKIVTDIKDRKPSCVYMEWDSKIMDEVLYIDLIMEDKKVKKVKYLDFLRGAEILRVKIIKRKVTEITETHGETKIAKYDGHNMIENGMFIPMEVKIKKTVFVVALPDGREMDVNENVINTTNSTNKEVVVSDEVIIQ